MVVDGLASGRVCRELAGAVFIDELVDTVVVDEAGRGYGFIINPALAWPEHGQSPGR